MTSSNPGSARMTVRVIDRSGWGTSASYPAIRRVTISRRCPVCGGERGTPYNHNFHEDGEWLSCDRWDNPCGHEDRYDAVLAEAAATERADTTGTHPHHQGDPFTFTAQMQAAAARALDLRGRGCPVPAAELEQQILDRYRRLRDGTAGSRPEQIAFALAVVEHRAPKALLALGHGLADLDEPEPTPPQPSVKEPTVPTPPVLRFPHHPHFRSAAVGVFRTTFTFGEFTGDEPEPRAPEWPASLPVDGPEDLRQE